MAGVLVALVTRALMMRASATAMATLATMWRSMALRRTRRGFGGCLGFLLAKERREDFFQEAATRFGRCRSWRMCRRHCRVCQRSDHGGLGGWGRGLCRPYLILFFIDDLDVVARGVCLGFVFVNAQAPYMVMRRFQFVGRQHDDRCTDARFDGADLQTFFIQQERAGFDRQLHVHGGGGFLH